MCSRTKQTRKQSSRTVTRPSADFQSFSTFQRIQKIFEKSCSTVTRQWSEVRRPSADCQTTFSDVSSNLEIFWKKSLNGHATVVGSPATVRWLSGNFSVVVDSKIVLQIEKNESWKFKCISKSSISRFYLFIYDVINCLNPWIPDSS